MATPGYSGGVERNASVRSDHRLSGRHGSDFRGGAAALVFGVKKNLGDADHQSLA
jgi:hypothetical protein